MNDINREMLDLLEKIYTCMDCAVMANETLEKHTFLEKITLEHTFIVLKKPLLDTIRKAKEQLYEQR